MNKGASVLTFVLLAAASMRAQSTFGSVTGIVTDKSGAILPGAQMELLHSDEETSRPAITSNLGMYEFVNVKPGLYSVTGMRQGFAVTRALDILVGARQVVRVDLVLEITPRTEIITVASAIPAFNTENGTVSQGKSFEEIARLPLNYRGRTTDPLPAVFVFPGVQGDNWNRASIGGGLPAQVEYSVDGITTVSPRLNEPTRKLYPSSEMLAEFRVSQAGNSAEFGRLGDVTMVTRSGGNSPHGSAFWYHQNSAFDAMQFGPFAERLWKVYHTFGGSLGGPVHVPGLYRGRNRTFFFADYENHRHPTPRLLILSVPLEAMRNGDLKGVPGPAAKDPLGGQAFPNDLVPASRINPVARRLFDKFYPLPTHPDAEVSTNYQSALPVREDAQMFDLRFDHYLRSSQQFSGRWSWNSTAGQDGWGIPPLSRYDTHAGSLMASHAWSIRAAAFNEARFGLSSYNSIEQFPIRGVDAVAELGLEGLDLSHVGDAGGMPVFEFGEGTGFAYVGHPRPERPQIRTIQFNDVFTLKRERHLLKFGGDVRHLTWRDTLHGGWNDDFGAFWFDGTFSGNAFADLLLGTPSITSYAVLGADLHTTTLHLQAFAQDRWAVTRRLRLDFGLRWELHPPMKEVTGNMTNFDHRTGDVIIPDRTIPPAPGFLSGINACPGYTDALPCTRVLTASEAGIPQTLRYIDLGGWAPRFGFAWQPFASTSTIVRGGFGLYIQPLLGGVTSSMTGVHTSDVRTYYPYSPGKPPLFTLPRIRGGSFDLAAPGTADFSRGADLNLRDPRSYQWTFTVERTLPWSITGRVSYLGVQSTGMPIAADFNQLRASPQRFSPSRRPFPAWGHLFSFEALGFANYQGLQVEASRRFRGDAFFQASYVYSKNLGNFMQNWGGETSFPRETFFTSISDRFNTRLDRGNVGGSRRDRFLLTGLFPLPFGKGRRFGTQWTGTRNALLGGWELSTVTLVQSGPFQTPLSGFDRSNTDMWGRFAYPRPDRIGDGNLPNPTADRWYDRSAFREVPAGAGRFGNTGVGVLKASGTVAIAAGLAKTGALTEKIRLRVEVTFTNLPNHPNYGPPVVVLSAPNFGRVYTDQGGENSGHRTGQVGVRFDF